MSDPTPKEIAISNALTEIYQTLGRKMDNGGALVKAWVRWIPNVPAEYIQKAFDLAMATTGRAMVPVPKQVKDAYGTIKRDDDSWDSRESTVIAHGPGWYQQHTDKRKTEYPEFARIFSTINVNDSRPMDPLKNEDDKYFMKYFNELYNRRFGGKMANKFDMNSVMQ